MIKDSICTSTIRMLTEPESLADIISLGICIYYIIIFI